MDFVVVIAVVTLWTLLFAAAAIVTLLPAAQPGHEADVLTFPLRRRGERDAA